MRLIQRSSRHTGIVIGEINGKKRALPLFSEDTLAEAQALIDQTELNNPKLFLPLTQESQELLLEELKEFREKHGCLSRRIMDQIRSGFSDGFGLNQCSALCFYC